MSDDIERQQVGELLKAFRVWRGLTPGQLASNAGVDVKTVRSLENGTRWPQDLTRSKIEYVLGLQNGIIRELLEDPSKQDLFWDLIRSNPPQHQNNLRWNSSAVPATTRAASDEDGRSESEAPEDGPGVVLDDDPIASHEKVIESSWQVATELAEAVLASNADQSLREKTRAAVHTIAAFLIIRILDSGNPARLEKWLERLYVEKEQLYHQLSPGDPSRPWVTEMVGREAQIAKEVIEEWQQISTADPAAATGSMLRAIKAELVWPPARKMVLALDIELRENLRPESREIYADALADPTLNLGTREGVEGYMGSAVAAAGDSGFEAKVFSLILAEAPDELAPAARRFARDYFSPEGLGAADDSQEHGYEAGAS